MGHISEPAGAVVIGCKVLPIFNEHGIVEGAMKKMVHKIDGKKAVARVKELLKLAAQARPHGATVSEGSELSRKGWRCSYNSCKGRAAAETEAAAAGGERRDELQLEQAELQVGRGQLLVSIVSCIFTVVVYVGAGKGVRADAIEERLLHVEAVIHEPAEYAVWRRQPKEHEEHGRRGRGGGVQLQDGAVDHHGFRFCGVGAVGRCEQRRRGSNGWLQQQQAFLFLSFS